MTEIIPIDQIKPNPDNPRTITQDQFEKLVKSIREFPDMLHKRPIIIDEDNIALGGNMRLKACREIGIKEIPIMRAEGWTDEQKKEFIVKDNLAYGEWDIEALAEIWNGEDLANWGFDINIGQITVEGEQEEIENLDQVYEPAKELHIQKEYLLITFETPEEYQEAIDQLNLQTVRTTNHEKQELNETGIERVISWNRIKESK